MEYRIGLLRMMCIFSGVLASIVSFGALVLAQFTGGKLLRLEEQDEMLARRLDACKPFQESWYSAARLWVQLLWCIYAGLAGVLWTQTESWTQRWIFLAIAFLYGLIVVCLIESIVPRLSLRRAAKCLCLYIPLLKILGWSTRPLVLLSALVPDHAREKNADPREEADNVATAEDEILSLITKGDEAGGEDRGIEEDERRMITGALALDDKMVREIMTPRVKVDSVEAGASVDEVVRVIVQSGHSRIPVYEGNMDKIKGIISAKDLLNEQKLADVRQHGLSALFRNPLFVPETKNIGDLLADFQSKKNHFAVVIDEYGGTSGIVTFEDVLEEVVGDIWDEYDEPVADVVPDSEREGWFIFDARTPIAQVNDCLGTTIPNDEDYDTLGGYLASEAGHIPKENERLCTDLLEAEIIEADPRLVKKVRVCSRPDMPDTDGQADAEQ